MFLRSVVFNLKLNCGMLCWFVFRDLGSYVGIFFSLVLSIWLFLRNDVELYISIRKFIL